MSKIQYEKMEAIQMLTAHGFHPLGLSFRTLWFGYQTNDLDKKPYQQNHRTKAQSLNQVLHKLPEQKAAKNPEEKK